MNETTAWYLGIRGEKQAYQPGYGYGGQQQQQPWYKTPYGMMAAGAGTAVAGQGMRRAGDFAGSVSDIYGGLAEGKMPEKFHKTFTAPDRRMLESMGRQDPKPMKTLQRGAGGVQRFSKGVGKAGLLGGLGLAGYGAYKAFKE
jgi:hypothetical protein